MVETLEVLLYFVKVGLFPVHSTNYERRLTNETSQRFYYTVGALIAFLIAAVAKSKTEYRNIPTGMVGSGRNINRDSVYGLEFEMEPMNKEEE